MGGWGCAVTSKSSKGKGGKGTGKGGKGTGSSADTINIKIRKDDIFIHPEPAETEAYEEKIERSNDAGDGTTPVPADLTGVSIRRSKLEAAALARLNSSASSPLQGSGAAVRLLIACSCAVIGLYTL